MVVTIQFQSVEDLQWVEPLLQLLKKTNAKVKFKGSTSGKRDSSKSTPSIKSDTSITEQLQGIISLPTDFDYKEFMADELLKKYAVNG